MEKKRLCKSKTDVKFMGVCAGFAEYFGWDPTWVRVIVAILSVGGVGTGVLLYLILAFCLPDAE